MGNNDSCSNGACSISKQKKHLSGKLLQKKDESGAGKTVYFFQKQNCIKCLQVKELINSVKDRHREINIKKFDVDTVEGLSKAAYYNAFELPVVIVFKEGNKVKRWDNTIPSEEEFSNTVL